MCFVYVVCMLREKGRKMGGGGGREVVERWRVVKMGLRDMLFLVCIGATGHSMWFPQWIRGQSLVLNQTPDPGCTEGWAVTI